MCEPSILKTNWKAPRPVDTSSETTTYGNYSYRHFQNLFRIPMKNSYLNLVYLELQFAHGKYSSLSQVIYPEVDPSGIVQMIPADAVTTAKVNNNIISTSFMHSISEHETEFHGNNEESPIRRQLVPLCDIKFRYGTKRSNSIKDPLHHHGEIDGSTLRKYNTRSYATNVQLEQEWKLYYCCRSKRKLNSIHEKRINSQSNIGDVNIVVGSSTLLCFNKCFCAYNNFSTSYRSEENKITPNCRICWKTDFELFSYEAADTRLPLPRSHLFRCNYDTVLLSEVKSRVNYFLSQERRYSSSNQSNQSASNPLHQSSTWFWKKSFTRDAANFFLWAVLLCQLLMSGSAYELEREYAAP